MPNIIPRDKIQDFIGFDAGPTEWMEVDQWRIDAFAKCTMDENFIHVNPEKAKKTRFGGTIAHGFLTLSLVHHFLEKLEFKIEGLKMAVNYGVNKVRFIYPVSCGSRVRMRIKILDILEKRPGQFLFTLRATMDIEGEEKPAMVADWLILEFTDDIQ
ncbi:MaoC family dehydratase [Microbulbifer sp. THAF38]|uniref:MaoC family dehydratase n=1 Tax=Microbulbifer sp. THAF38 TaxID=2587856 RepID=UPI001268439E|nr:MaoC family dehydratase [Microbulbifer sp. THAF38]QFT55177.1 putative enoyl-CoA hydratase 1 [Microbulbifer sp. THAF38]